MSVHFLTYSVHRFDKDQFIGRGISIDCDVRRENSKWEMTVRQSDWTLVRSLPLFSEMSEANYKEILNAALLQRFPQHVTLINEGDLPDFLHIVVEGSVELFSAHNGRETAIDIIHWAGTELGEMANTIIKQLNFENLTFDVVMIGSMWDGGSLLVEKARETIQAYAPGASMVRLTAPPVVGAFLLGMVTAGVKPGLDIHHRIIENSRNL